jgi:hypothetical protein
MTSCKWWPQEDEAKQPMFAVFFGRKAVGYGPIADQLDHRRTFKKTKFYV